MKMNLLNGSTVLNLEKDFGKQTSHRFSLADNSNVQEKDNSIILNVFPNPADQEMIVSIKCRLIDDYNISIADVFGKEIYSGTFNNISDNEIKLNVSEFAAGAYYLKILGTQENLFRKIIIR
jgi:hypothetical protein